MNKRRERALEAFLYITFPIALFAGCTDPGNTKEAVSSSVNAEFSINAVYPAYDVYEEEWSASGDPETFTRTDAPSSNPKHSGSL